MYNKCRLRDLGFQGMNAYQQAEKVYRSMRKVSVALLHFMQSAIG